MKQQRNLSFVKKFFHKHRLKSICVLACAVVFCTVSALVIPALAQEGAAHCGQKEHSHSESCYEKTLICGQEESTEHAHTDKCYDSVLSCENKEHTHELSCYSDPDADLETAENWENTFSKVELSGDYSKDVIAIAKTQLGYKESEKNYKVDENGDAKGYTRYGAWYGDEYADWDGMFASFCINYAKVELPETEKTCTDWIKVLSAEKYDRYFDAKNYAPKQGDLIFIDSDKDGQADKMGFVAEVNKATEEKSASIKTIEGDSNNSVEYVEYEKADKKIIGYGKLPEKSDKMTLTYEGKDYTVNVSYEKEAKIPEGTELSVKEIKGDEYDKTCAKAKKALNADKLGFARFFDISLVKDGKELEPAAAVDVSITYKEEVKIDKGESAAAVHFAESGVEVLKAEVDSSKTASAKTEKGTTKGDTFNFTQDSFSVTGTVVTVDEVLGSSGSGQKFMIITRSESEVSVEGGGTALLPGPYYALAGDGTGVMIKSYDPDSGKVVLFKGTDAEALKWTYDKNTNATYPLKNVKTENYLSLVATDKVVGQADNPPSTNITYDNLSITETNRNEKKGQIKRSVTTTTTSWGRPQTSTTTYYLGLNSDKGIFTTNTNSPSDVIFVSKFDIEEDSAGSAGTAVYDFPNHKKIDYLGDNNTDNSQNTSNEADTALKGEDLYRLYLDINGNTEPMDLLFVVDRSGSMYYDMDGIKKYNTDGSENNDWRGDPKYNPDEVRCELVSDLLNGQVNAVDDSGLVSRFLALNPKNKIAVTSFEGQVTENEVKNWGQSGEYLDKKFSNFDQMYKDNYKNYDCAVLLDWKNKNSYIDDPTTTSKDERFVNTGEQYWNGTNYIAGLKLADEMFNRPDIKNDGNKKMMIFLSDGVPTFYINDDGYRRGNEGVDTYNALVECRQETMDYYKETFRTNNPEVLVHTVGVSADINGATSNKNPEILKYMADEGGGNFLPVTTAEDMSAVPYLIFPKGAEITDTLSEYVEYYGKQPDLKVTRTNAAGDTQVLYENDNPITPPGETKKIIESVEYNSDTRTVTAKFDKDFVMDHSWTYTLSFNVKATGAAYDEYAKNGYGKTKGDLNTNYENSKTSSDQSGLHSNTEATVKYTINNIEYSEDYPKPVIQVDKCKLTIKKTDENNNSLEGVEFTMTKDGTPAQTYNYKTDEYGTVVISSSDLLNGKYTLEEKKTLDGYDNTGEKVEFTVLNGRITHTQSLTDWTWGTDPEKVGESDGNYEKNNDYSYELSLVNRSKPQQVILKKTDEGGNSLGGASFSLYSDCTEGTADKTTFHITEPGENQKIVYGKPVDDKQNMTSTDKGEIYTGELSGGKYYLFETKAPDGYHRLEEPVVITVGKIGVTATYCGDSLTVPSAGTDQKTYTVTISNTPGGRLPDTGGSGTGWYSLGGILLMAAALLCYTNKRRRKEAK